MTPSGTAGECDQFREVAAEVALGLLTGRERAAALAHLQRCPSCRQQVATLEAVHDRLRTLIPAAEPSAGFEQRVLERFDVANVPGRARSTRRVNVALAAAVIVLSAFAGGWATATAMRAAPSAVASPLMARDRQVGDVIAATDRLDFLSVYLDVARPGRLTCQLLRGDGSVAATETYDAGGGTAWWSIQRLDKDVTAIRVSDASGDLLAAGTLPQAP